MRHPASNRVAPRRVRGMTLIELMIALLIGMILSLAVFGIMATSEGRRRTLGSSADLDQGSSVAMFQLDRWVRSAGTGFGQSYRYAYGCPLYASKDKAQILPASPEKLEAPFNTIKSGVFRLAPVLILPGQTKPGAAGYVSTQPSDMLVLMSAGAGNGSVPTPFSKAAVGHENKLDLTNAVAFSKNDLVLLASKGAGPGNASSIAPCLLTQADSGVDPVTSKTGIVTLAGPWHAAAVDSVSVTQYSNNAVAIDLGDPSGHPPSFQLVGVGERNTLFSYDLLQATGAPLQKRAEGVFELHAVYGIDTDNDGKVDKWIKADGGDPDYTLAVLTAGDQTAAGRLHNIKAVRIGLILRTSLPEKDAVKAATQLKLFEDDSDVTYTRDLTGAESHYRYRTLEATIPLRNNLL